LGHDEEKEIKEVLGSEVFLEKATKE